LNYFIDLVFGDKFALQFVRDWYMGETVYILRMTPKEFEELQTIIDQVFDREH
jgi:FtsZ-interacting cell division protein YlmF